MEKNIVSIEGMSVSMSSYVVVLCVNDSSLKIPVVLSESDGSRLYMKIDHMETDSKSTHKVISDVTRHFGIELIDIYIKSASEGIFKVNLHFCNNEDEYETECSIADALFFSLYYDTKMYCHPDVIRDTAIDIDDDGSKKDKNSRGRTVQETIETLEAELAIYVQAEEYELAGQIKTRLSDLQLSKKLLK